MTDAPTHGRAERAVLLTARLNPERRVRDNHDDPAWSAAIGTLITLGLIEQDGDSYQLTDTATPVVNGLINQMRERVYG